MSVSYSLDMATEKTALEVAWHLHDAARSVRMFEESVTPELLLDEGAVTQTGLWVCVGEEKPQPWNPVITDLGFTPTASVRFQLGRSRGASDQQTDMIRLVSGLLSRAPGEAVLHFQFEVIWLLRRGGELALNERDDLWPPQRLAAVSQPYRRATHEFSEE
ncbi:SitI3 family protein [Streptomyces sp. NPDC048516]|uniref:SitI3 family protein n=1 Tax=Streptomyces sp. NPDC048516 TaxID=3365565 RepID=UPI00371EB3AD